MLTNTINIPFSNGIPEICIFHIFFTFCSAPVSSDCIVCFLHLIFPPHPPSHSLSYFASSPFPPGFSSPPPQYTSFSTSSSSFALLHLLILLLFFTPTISLLSSPSQAHLPKLRLCCRIRCSLSGRPAAQSTQSANLSSSTAKPLPSRYPRVLYRPAISSASALHWASG